MPQFQAFRRRWFFASDDLPFAALCGAFFHTVWAVVLTLAALVDRPEGCDGHQGVGIFLYGLIASFVVSVIMDGLIAIVGLRGTMFESGKREASGMMLYFQVANFGLKIALTSYGTRLVFSGPPPCLEDSGTFEQMMKGVIISTWAVIGLFILFGVASLRRGPSTDTLATWEKRVRCLNVCCCGGFRQDHDTLAQAAWVFADFFKPIDFTPLDTVTAMVLAAHKQRFQRMIGSAGHNRTKPKTWLGHKRFAEHDMKSPLQILENEEQTSSSLDSRPLAAPVTIDEMKDGRATVLDGEPGEDLGSSPNIERGKIEIVVETHGENANNGCVREDNLPTSVPLTVSNRTTQRRKRNMAVDLSALNFSAGFDGMIDDHYPVFNSDQSGYSSSARNDQKSDGSMDTSLQNSPQNIAEGHGQETDALNRKPRDDHDDCPESPGPPEPETEVSNIPNTPMSSGSSVKTTLTWGDSFTGPFLTPPGGDRSLGVSSGEVPLEVLQKLLKYHRYANAVYGALLYVASGRSLASFPLRCCSLCIRATPPNAIRRNIRYMRPTRQKSHPLLEDVNLIRRLDNEAILKWGVKGEDIIYRSYANTIAGHLPYFIALDREDRAVVVAVRGTSTWTDLVTDFLIHPEPLSSQELKEIEGMLQEMRGGTVRDDLPEVDRVSVHKGILGAARALVKGLEDCGILDVLEARSQGDFIIEENIVGWQLILTGHSLGAGVASLASLLLRKRFIDIHCYAVSPPGGLMSPELANAMAPFCTSLLHGKDMIPRLGIGPSERLRDQMVLSAAQSRRNKTQILMGALFKRKWTEDELFLKVDSVSSEALAAYQIYKSSIDRTSQGSSLCRARKFVAPGKIVFLRPHKEKIGESEHTNRTFQAVWTSGGEVTKEGILMSAHMFTDHFPFLSIDSLEASIQARVVEAERDARGHNRPSSSSME